MKPIEQIYKTIKSAGVIIETGKDGIACQFNHLRVIASWGEGWEHVSVSIASRCPFWNEMCFVKDIFWNDNETVIQYHPTKENYINQHPYCLHLWKPINLEIPKPPKIFVGIQCQNKG